MDSSYTIIDEIGSPYEKDVFHYTKLENLFKIITPEGLRFHASRYDVMNDPEDSVHMMYNINKELCKSGAYEVFGDFGSEEALPFLVSFSCLEDNRIMWRLYDADVMLHIDSNVIYNHCLAMGCKHTYMGKVEYSETAVKGTEAAKRLEKYPYMVHNDKVNFQTAVPLTLYKHPDFKEENEWRLMCFDKDEICSEIKCKGSRYGRLWLYREVFLPKECLKDITLRVYDRNIFSSLCEEIRLMLRQYGYPSDYKLVQRTKIAEARR